MSDFNKMELVTSVDLNYNYNVKQSKPVYHIIYASQLYGTVFAIYGRFEGTENINNGEQAFVISKISLALLNYKGIINIGFTGDSIAWDENQNSISFSVIGTSTIVDKELIFVNPIVVNKGVCRPIVFYRKLYPLPGFESYVGKRINNTSNAITSEPPVSPLFDSEFNDRDGIDFYNRDLRIGMSGYKPEVPSTDLIASPRCTQSHVRLVY